VDTAGIYSNTTTPRNLDFRLFNNYDRGNSALKLTDPLTYSSFIIKHKNGGSSSTLDRADENYIYSDSPAGHLNIGRYSDIYLWADQNRYYDTSATHAPSVFINSIDGSVDILKDFYLGGLPFYITSSGTAYANGIPISGSINVSDTAPIEAIMGSLWYDTVDGRMYVDYDGSWVDANPQATMLAATTSTLGGVIVDGTSIVINNSVISAMSLVNGIYTATLGSTGTLSLPDMLVVPGTIYQGTAFDGIVYNDTPIRIDNDVDSYAQVIFKNHNTGSNASTDIILLNDQGTDEVNYIDMGINSSNFVSSQYSIATTGSGYLYTSNTDLFIGTDGPNTKLVLYAGGSTASNAAVTIDQTALTFNRKVVVSVDQPSEMEFLSENTLEHVDASAVFKAVNDTGDYIKMGINSSLRLDGQILPGESFMYTSREASGTMHIGNRSSINFYADGTDGFSSVPTIRLDASDRTVVFDSDALPHHDMMHNLGNVNYRWDNLYVYNLDINDHVMTISTAGSLTIDGAVVHGAIPAFRVNGGGASATDIAPGTLTNVHFVVDYNQGDHLNTSTGIFTAPQAGIYSVFFNAKTSTSNNVLSQAAVVKNSSTNVCFWEVSSTSTVGHMGVSGHVMLAQGDTLQANVIAGLIDFDANDNWGATYVG
jgi:hypothetical protein